MRNKMIRNKAFMCLLALITGCSTFFEEDISRETIKILSPVAGTETEIATQTFWWEKMEGAAGYHLQIVTPSFDSMEMLILDTLISSDKFMTVLYPSYYEWRVRAENSAWQSQWATNTLKIYATGDLTRQKINLQEPGVITNRKTNRFKWDGLYNAEHYSIVAFKDHWDGLLVIGYTNVDSSFFESELEDGMYIWGVKAVNATSETLYSQKSLLVDTTPPAVPVLLTPSDKVTVANLKVSFSWNSSDKTSGLAHDTLKVFSDKALTKIVKSMVTESKNSEINFTERMVYYWTVCSVDKAGNRKETPNPFSFTIQ